MLNKQVSLVLRQYGEKSVVMGVSDSLVWGQVPKPKKHAPDGEDGIAAYDEVVSGVRRTVAAVSDGVSSAESNLSKIMADCMTKAAVDFYRDHYQTLLDSESPVFLMLTQIFSALYDHIKGDLARPDEGSCTLSFYFTLQRGKDLILYTFVLGDSGISIYSGEPGSQAVFQMPDTYIKNSEVQVPKTPAQLSSGDFHRLMNPEDFDPAEFTELFLQDIDSILLIQGGQSSVLSQFSQAILLNTDLKIVIGSDGIFDNLHKSQISEILDLPGTLSEKTQNILRAAFNRSRTSFPNLPLTPYWSEYIELCRHFGIANQKHLARLQAGKPDDLSVAIAAFDAPKAQGPTAETRDELVTELKRLISENGGNLDPLAEILDKLNTQNYAKEPAPQGSAKRKVVCRPSDTAFINSKISEQELSQLEEIAKASQSHARFQDSCQQFFDLFFSESD